MSGWFTVDCWWEPRAEDARAIAKRLAAFFTELAAIDSIFSRWSRGDIRHRSVVPRDFAVLRSTVKAVGGNEKRFELGSEGHGGL